MWGFSKKRFFLTLGLSILVWVMSGVLQAVTGFSNYFTIFHACSLTGYPIALCISSNDSVKINLISLTNIIFWFCVLHFIWKWVIKRQN